MLFGKCINGLILVWLLLNGGVALGQTFSGTYSAQGDQGNQMILTLAASADGSLSGSLTAQDTEVTLSGWQVVMNAFAVGSAQSVAGVVPVVISLTDSAVLLTFFAYDDQGAPDRSSASNIQFSRTDSMAASQSSVTGLPPTQPLQSGVISPSASPITLPPGFTEEHQGLQPWLQHLAGKRLTQMDSYYSADSFGGGGYSSEQVLILCSDRSFVFSSSSSTSVGVDGVSGNSAGAAGGQGRWTLATNGQVVGLILAFEDGQRGELALTMNERSETFVNGARTFVTPAEVCY